MAKINIDIAVNNRGAQAKVDRLTRSTKEASRGFDKLSLSVKQSSGAFGSFVGNVGPQGGKTGQSLNLGQNCVLREIVLHEVLHALGRLTLIFKRMI